MGSKPFLTNHRRSRNHYFVLLLLLLLLKVLVIEINILRSKSNTSFRFCIFDCREACRNELAVKYVNIQILKHDWFDKNEILLLNIEHIW